MPQQPRQAPHATSKATTGKAVSSSGRPNSVNLKSQALDVLLDQLDAPAGGTAHGRNFVRWPFRRESLEVLMLHPGGNMVSIRVACRNISRGGICVLHNSYMHTGSECRVMLVHPVRGVTPIQGKVVRCQHRAGLIHELGISFKKPLEVQEYLRPDPMSNTFSLERVDAKDLRGRMLLIDPSENERSTLTHFLKETSLGVDGVGSLAEAVLACEGADVVVASLTVTDGEPATVVETLRKSGYNGPVVFVAPDASPQTRARVAGAKGQAIIVQPLTQDLLLLALGEVLLFGPTTKAPKKAPAAALTASTPPVDKPDPPGTSGMGVWRS
jgi:CheY-like chemotaxis protein